MDLKPLIVLTFVVGYAISFDTTSTANEMNEQKFEKNSTYCSMKTLKKVSATMLEEIIGEYLSNEDLRNVTNIEMLADVACELSHRFRISHYQNGKIIPPFLARTYERMSQINITNDENAYKIMSQLWSPRHAILFGSEKLLNITNVMELCHILLITSQEDHLKIFTEFVLGNETPFIPDEIKGSPMNGVIFPHSFLPLDINLDYMNIVHTPDNYPDDLYQSLRNNKNRTKLAIIFASDDKHTPKEAENRALIAAQTMRKDFGNMPICVVAQSDTREKDRKKFGWYWESTVLLFRGLDVSASTLVVSTKDEKTLKTKFEEWKKELFFLNNHQTIAFHFTVVNGTEPEKSEKIFSETFPSIPLSTLRLIDGPSITGVNYQAETESHFDSGPVYAIVGFRKFG